ncbi:MAG TPA: substrate-binding domain-containing protein [Streptosporangiaceae bacterium]|nr:substrate-binding domain-containing protein [Streptosporangiaceae bacterium]
MAAAALAVTAAIRLPPLRSWRAGEARRSARPGRRLPGNPGRVHGPAGLRGLRIARRPFGTGTRVLLDRLLADAGIPPASITGPDAASHLEVAMTIAAGQADAGLGVRAAATALDLGFVPVTWEDFDIVLSGDALPAAGPLITRSATPGHTVRGELPRRLRPVPRRRAATCSADQRRRSPQAQSGRG